MPLSQKRGQKKSAKKKQPPATRKWVYRFRQGRASQKALLGGKGANLCEMTRLGLPVPPGFIVSTEACNAYFDAKGFPTGLWPQVLEALKDLETTTGRVFGDPFTPLLVSCRSGAKFSMPGMMDTVLNLGMNDAVAAALSAKTGLERFTWDAYRRLVQMFSTVVLGLDHEPFEAELAARRRQAQVENDSGLDARTLADVTRRFLAIVHEKTGQPFPQEPLEQLRLAIEAVFKSWNGKRAIDYRNASGIPHDLGTAVNIQMMVFGNTGERSATGVVTTRNVSTGEKQLEGDYLLNAQGEDVVSGTRTTRRITALADDMPEVAKDFAKHCDTLERHFRDVQDVEFTVEDGTLWVLQTRDAKRSAQAAVRIAVELAREKRISKDEAVLRVKPEHVDFFLHPQFDPQARKEALASGTLLAKGLNVSPGAATGAIVFDPDTAERLGRKEKKAVILVRAETKPDDVHGMLAAKGILTSRGGRTSHAALVARQFGKPAVVGVTALDVDVEQKRMTGKGRMFQEGDVVSLDGTTGEVFAGEVPTMVPAFDDPHLLTLLKWADDARVLGVWANADYPKDAERARRYGAEGIGLCRTEHMFFQTERLPIVQQMILAATDAERDEALAKLLPMQRGDFTGLFEAMNGQPVTIRLIDPPLHEFLPGHDELLQEVTELETRLKLDGQQVDALGLESRLSKQKRLLAAVEGLREQNPMLGLRGVRLGIHLPGLVRMQVRAIFEAACDCQRRGVKVYPKVMIPLTSLRSELVFERGILEQEARAVMAEQKTKVKYQFGTMIEVPRAAVTADEIAELAEFFSFGTNDLTQTTFGISRDDAETGFLLEYLEKRILRENPFATLDQAGVGALMELAVKKGRKVRPSLEVGICGEHGGDPKTIAFCHRLGLTYVSCSPFRVPIARLAAAHAALEPIR
ncbi:MAG: pyruvate, phosphate dikinase [Myxococcaceae bacterium]|nr:pyruvate, phosphate dikinase [Myxococcaceae bacterium]